MTFNSHLSYADQKELVVIDSEDALIVCRGKVHDREVHFQINEICGITFDKCDIVAQDATLSDCCFVDCGKIECQLIKNSVLTNCDEIELNDGGMDTCIIVSPRFIRLVNCVVNNCAFNQIGHHEDIICMEDTQILNCKFKKIGLCCEAYLIDAVGDSSVEDCSFVDCSTDREDLELIHCEELVGKLFKRKKEFDITYNCSGLDNVTRGDGPIEIGSFDLD